MPILDFCPGGLASPAGGVTLVVVAGRPLLFVSEKQQKPPGDTLRRVVRGCRRRGRMRFWRRTVPPDLKSRPDHAAHLSGADARSMKRRKGKPHPALRATFPRGEGHGARLWPSSAVRPAAIRRITPLFPFPSRHSSRQAIRNHAKRLSSQSTYSILPVPCYLLSTPPFILLLTAMIYYACKGVSLWSVLEKSPRCGADGWRLPFAGRRTARTVTPVTGSRSARW